MIAENAGHFDIMIAAEKKARAAPLSTKSPNPKDLQGIKKPPLNLVPSAGDYYAALAFLDGALKYGPFNWREYPVKASIYVAAARRHINDWFDGQEFAEDTGVPNLGGAIACLFILCDVSVYGNLIDDRPKSCPTSKLHEEFKPIIDRLFAQYRERQAAKEK